MSINLHIERLILEGLPVAQSHGDLVRASVEAELARLLASPNLNVSSGALARVTAPAFQLKSESSPAQLGLQIGHALYGAISQSGPSASSRRVNRAAEEQVTK